MGVGTLCQIIVLAHIHDNELWISDTTLILYCSAFVDARESGILQTGSCNNVKV